MDLIKFQLREYDVALTNYQFLQSLFEYYNYSITINNYIEGIVIFFSYLM